MRVAVIGTGCTGTTFTTIVLKRLGLRVRHERMGPDGTVDGFFTARVDPAKFVVLHQVRDPLRVIPSLATAHEKSWELVARDMPIVLQRPLPLRCLAFWLDWTAIADAKARMTYRVEDFAAALPRICALLGIEHRPEVLARARRAA